MSDVIWDATSTILLKNGEPTATDWYVCLNNDPTNPRIQIEAGRMLRNLQNDDIYLAKKVNGETVTWEKLETTTEEIVKQSGLVAFEPSITFGGGSAGMQYHLRNGFYVRTGKMIEVEITINLSQKGSSTGGASIEDLPFFSKSAQNYFPGLTCEYSNLANLGSSDNHIVARVTAGSKKAQLLVSRPNASATTLSQNNFTSGSQVILSGSYFAET